MCIDLRPLNQRIHKQKAPFPIEDQVNSLQGKEVFTVLDLKDGFHQIDVHPDDIKYFAFAIPDGQFKYVRLYPSDTRILQPNFKKEFLRFFNC